MDKSQHAALVASGVGIETFEHEFLGHFDITSLRQGIHDGTIRWMPRHAQITPELQEIISKQRDVDLKRVAELTRRHMLDEPAIMIYDAKTGEHALIDGTHRLAGKIARGDEEFFFFEVLLEDAPRLDESLHSMQIEYGDKDFIERAKKRRDEK